MVAQKGRELLLKVDVDGVPTFGTVAGLRTKNFSINNEGIEFTNSDSANQFREMLDGGGVKSISASGAGKFLDDTIFDTVRGYVMNGTIRQWQIIVPDYGTFQGLFHISVVGMDGEYTEAADYNFSIESAGDISFTAA